MTAPCLCRSKVVASVCPEQCFRHLLHLTAGELLGAAVAASLQCRLLRQEGICTCATA